jgi:uncharacterized RDD family membrane protein YckC
MSSQPPGGDPPTEPTGTPGPASTPPPQPGADTERVATPEDAPRGVISSAPVGWAAPDARPPAPAAADAPVVDWAPPAAAAPAARVGEGLVIAGVFSRFVAYTIDIVLLAAINVVVGYALGTFDPDADPTPGLVVNLALVALEGVYFVGLWVSPWRATIGMRLIGIRLLGATDAATLPLGSAILRWFVLTGAVRLLVLIPAAGATLGFAAIAWEVILLVTTATDRLHQGLHDRWARSVVVQPAPGGSGAAVVGCLVLLFLAFALPFALLAASGDALREILSRVGESI